MRYFYISMMLLGMLCHLHAEEAPIAEEDNTVSIPADTIRLIYFLPSDRDAQEDIDTNIETWITNTQTAFADLMEAHGYGRKTFRFQTDDKGNAVIHHIIGEFTDEYYESENKWEVWNEIRENGHDFANNIYITFIDLSSEIIDTWCGTGGDWTNANGGVVTLPASGGCFEEENEEGLLTGVNLIAHELGHALGLRHDYRGHSDSSEELILYDKMVTSSCATKWLDGHRYFNDYEDTTTEPTLIEMETPSGNPDKITFTFTIADADGLHQAHFLTTRQDTYDFDDLSILNCKALVRTETEATAEFSTSALTVNADSVTLRVMDATGSMTEVLFSINLLPILADLNADGVINMTDLLIITLKFNQKTDGPEDINGDGVVNIIDLLLVAAVISGDDEAAPSVSTPDFAGTLTEAKLKELLQEARQLNLTDPALLQGILILEELLKDLVPQKTVLLPNYPNPFNPETWIPYQLAEPTDVSISIYTLDGKLVRSMDLGQQPAGKYYQRNRAVYWDGKNHLGEPVASSIYFYTLTAGPYTATRKMLIQK